MGFLLRPSLYVGLFCLLGVVACAEVTVPDPRNVNIPTPVAAEKRKEAVNERPDSVLYLPLGEDVLVPERIAGDDLPKDKIGSFELRGETLAGALQLILADYDISIAFESDAALTRKITASNLQGELGKVVDRVCSLADLYCSYEDKTLVVKDSQVFTVTLPPLADAEGAQDFITDVIQGLTAIIGQSGTAPVSDPTTRTLIYSATQRTSKLAENYFQRLRANTAMIVYETYIWEVALNAGNSAGIDWEQAKEFGKFKAGITFNGSVAADFTNPVSIGLPQTVGASATDMLQFLSKFGAVKTISQPQITVLSGSEAELRVADTQNYVSEVSSTVNANTSTTSVSTDSVDSGFTLTVGSSWDKSTIYSNIGINLTNVVKIDDFTFSDSGAGGTDTIIQLPQTTERELKTQVRVRPGDSVLIGGLVREIDNFDSRGPGFMEPVVPDSRTAKTENLELVIMLRPRVVVYTANSDKRYTDFIAKKNAGKISPKVRGDWIKSDVLPPPPLKVAEPISAPVVSESIPALDIEPKVAEPISAPVSLVESPTEKFKSGYTPGYVSRTGVVSDTVQLSPSPMPAPSPTSVVSSQESAPYSVEVYDYQDTISPDYNEPLSSDIYNNAAPLNVYEAYERSKNSYYAP